MSMFRRPSEDSSSSEEDSTPKEEQQTTASPEDVVKTPEFASPGVPTASPPQYATGSSSTEFRDLLVHSLLEDKALRDAADHLGKDRSDPEVQELARTTYRALSRQLEDSNAVDARYASDEMRQHRATAQEGIDAFTRMQLTDPTAAGTDPANQALVMPSGERLGALFNLRVTPSELTPLQSYPGIHNDHYVRDFVELGVVGKGGYGKVFKAKHKLDNAMYAVKRIVSSTRMRKIQEQGLQELEKLLEEVRSLAQFDHTNIVRYHNAWLEFSSAPTEMPVPPQTFVGSGMFIEGAAEHSFSDDHEHDLHSNFPDIVFESSGPGPKTDNAGDAENPAPRRNRRISEVSQATVATISSKSAGEDAGEDDAEDEDEDEDVETVPREDFSHSEDSSGLSESMMSHSDMPHELVSSRRPTGPILTLNVQMSLYDTNLAVFMSDTGSTFETHPTLHHCFHPCISLELLAPIVAGVAYLHEHGVVHRDLKPANIFLSLSTSKTPPPGSADLSTCRQCPAREYLHVTPRIGDFGLVAALGESYATTATDNTDTDTAAVAKPQTQPVGTEFYRPQRGEPPGSDQLDIYALGVMAVELLHAFATRMERAETLTLLRKSVFPEDFVRPLGELDGEFVKVFITSMVCHDVHIQQSCEDVRVDLTRLVQQLRQ
ncbi:kinase-like domain-containing protein [Massariosphaeria phaeospora]|uniref:Kinase-like domain-containing protein n=1 Tax=Massariosphaeria phaeospora TaxID=100035 RepID=A0A7C8MHT1_9PLEO|nr:kinase-like domain-containing protein [Massariosphaeria phaeospora]